MKLYTIKIDGFFIGIVELLPEEAKELEKDNGVVLERV